MVIFDTVTRDILQPGAYIYTIECINVAPTLTLKIQEASSLSVTIFLLTHKELQTPVENGSVMGILTSE